MRTHISSAWVTFVLCLLLLSTSCVKEDEIATKDEYPEFLVFGVFFTTSACSGSENCIEIYKADATGLSEDVLDDEPTGLSGYSGNYSHGLSVTSYENVTELFDNNPIPTELLDLPNGQVGNMNPFGQNFYLEYKTKSGGYQYWILGGAFDGSMPIQIQNYLGIISNATFFASQG